MAITLHHKKLTTQSKLSALAKQLKDGKCAEGDRHARNMLSHLLSRERLKTLIHKNQHRPRDYAKTTTIKTKLNIMCYTCGKSGHIAPNCSDKDKRSKNPNSISVSFVTSAGKGKVPPKNRRRWDPSK